MDSAGISKTAFTSEDCNISLLLLYSDVLNGAVAHLVERQVRNLKVASSSLVGSKNIGYSLDVDRQLCRYHSSVSAGILDVVATTFPLSFRLIAYDIFLLYSFFAKKQNCGSPDFKSAMGSLIHR